MRLSENHKEILFHSVFWTIHLFFRVEITRFNEVSTGLRLGIELAELPQKMFLTYYIIYFLVPRFLQKENFKQLVLWSLIGLLIIILWRRVHDYYFLYPIIQPEVMQGNLIHFWDIRAAASRLIYVLPSTAAGVALYFIRDWFKNYKKAKELEKEKLQAELNYLKAQIHPHFLFNTLNNLYALTIKQRSEAPDVILKLSALLSYMLYDTNEPKLSLKKEIAQVENLVTLESLRYGDRLEHSFNVTGDYENVRIAPMLLIPFVENAFKHGTSTSLHKSWVSISLHIEDQWLTLQVENSMASDTKETKDYRAGIGLKNIKRRLDLLYPNKHELRLTSGDTFSVWLRLDITNS